MQEQQNALNEELGVASAENPEGIGEVAGENAEDVSKLSQAVTSSAGPTVGSILSGAIGAAGAAAPTIGKAFGV